MKKTVFIVGAGASSDFGFPLGSELAAQIRDGLDIEQGQSGGGSRPIVDALSRSGGFSGDHQFAINEIRGGLLTAPSIDFFLETRSDRQVVVEVGKVAIAYHILEAERRCPLSQAQDTDFNITQNALKAVGTAWTAVVLKGLAGSMRPGNAGELLEKSAFVVFNYDRCLEQYFYHAIQHVFSINPKAASKIMRRAKLFHPFGSLGRISMDNQGGEDFGGRHVNAGMKARDFTTFYEEVVDKEALDAAAREIDSTEQLVFLGFGFHPRNLRLLFPGGPPNVEMWGTLWLDGPEKLAAMDFLGTHSLEEDDYGVLRWEKATCGNFLRARSHAIFGAEG